MGGAHLHGGVFHGGGSVFQFKLGGVEMLPGGVAPLGSTIIVITGAVSAASVNFRLTDHCSHSPFLSMFVVVVLHQPL